MTQTYHPGSVPIDLRKRSATATAQWLLERKEDSNSPIYHANQLEVLICGEEGFSRILHDIRQAKHSVEIICWGFDPAMELERKGHTWPRGPTWGDLLRDVAAGKYNNGKPVEVRVLCWHEGMLSAIAKNTPGYGTLDADQVKRIRHHERLSGKPHEAGLTPQERRSYFNALWFFEATHGTHPHLIFKVRAANSDKIGHGTSMPNQDKEVERELAVREQEKKLATYEFKERKNGAPPELVRGPKPATPDGESRSNADIAKELDSLGIKTLVASLWTYDHAGDSKGEKYREIYIHSKLMIIDDAFFTLGSANMNLRSMAVDAEINIGCDDPLLSGKLRREVFAMHSANAAGCDGGSGSTAEISSTFRKWGNLLRDNRREKNAQSGPQGFLIPFFDDRTSNLRLA